MKSPSVPFWKDPTKVFALCICLPLLVMDWVAPEYWSRLIGVDVHLASTGCMAILLVMTMARLNGRL
jgi:hypothetical protein